MSKLLHCNCFCLHVRRLELLFNILNSCCYVCLLIRGISNALDKVCSGNAEVICALHLTTSMLKHINYLADLCERCPYLCDELVCSLVKKPSVNVFAHGQNQHKAIKANSRRACLSLARKHDWVGKLGNSACVIVSALHTEDIGGGVVRVVGVTACTERRRAGAAGQRWGARPEKPPTKPDLDLHSGQGQGGHRAAYPKEEIGPASYFISSIICDHREGARA